MREEEVRRSRGKFGKKRQVMDRGVHRRTIQIGEVDKVGGSFCCNRGWSRVSHSSSSKIPSAVGVNSYDRQDPPR